MEQKLNQLHLQVTALRAKVQRLSNVTAVEQQIAWTLQDVDRELTNRRRRDRTQQVVDAMGVGKAGQITMEIDSIRGWSRSVVRSVQLD